MPGQLSTAEKERRARALIAIGNETAQVYQTRWLNRDTTVLLEERCEDGWTGYTPEYIQVTVPDCPLCRRGALLQVRLTEGAGEGMRGTLL